MFTMLKLWSQRARIARLSAQIAKFGSNRRGNVAVITALACLPMIAAVGCVIDYSDASMIKTKLQAASDAAALATVSVNSSVIATAKGHVGQRNCFRRIDLRHQFFQFKPQHCAGERWLQQA